MEFIKVKQLLVENNLQLIAGAKGIDEKIVSTMINRPGLELAGFFDYYDSERVILLGSKEVDFFQKQSPKEIRENVYKIFKEKPPCVVFSCKAEIPAIFIEYADEFAVCLAKSSLRTTPTSSKIYNYLQDNLAQSIAVHGCLVDINGMGTLITGKSGIGKSEIALDLIKKGHQLIADDSVNIIEKEPGNLIGRAPELLKRFIEIRGIGIVDVVSMFGIGAYCESKKIDLLVELQMWDENKVYDRLGLECEKIKFFDTEIPKVIIPVFSGRPVSLLVESAAMNEKLKGLGYFAAEEFVKNVNSKASNGGNENV